MAVIGIITCGILELEFASILAMDPCLARVTVLADGTSNGLVEALRERRCRDLQLIPHVSSFHRQPSVQVEVLIRVLEIALHRNRKRLQRALTDAAREIAGRVDVLLLGYGLCGNALENVPEMLDVKVPVFVPLDAGHPVDDCVGLLIGGRSLYHDELCKVPGTVFMIPGFVSHLQQIVDEDPADTEHLGLRRMFKRYQRALFIVNPVMEEQEMRRRAAEFIEMLNLQSDACQGTLDLLVNAWQNAKASLGRKAVDGLNDSEAGHFHEGNR